MASHVYVVDSTARRTQIKTTPGKYLREVLEEACTKLKLNPEQYTLKNNAKQLDLSLTFRLSGLVSGAKLQLTQASRSPSVVNVALQLPESEGSTRLQDKFPSNTSLWLVLRKFEDAVAGAPAKKLNLTQRGVPSTDSGAGHLCYEQPCLNVMGRELSSFAELQKTLAQLGYNSGSVLLRLTFKNAGTPMEEAMQQITGYFAAIGASGSSSTPAEKERQAAHGVHADTTQTSVPDSTAENAAAPDDVAGQDPSGDTIMTPPPPTPPVQTPFQEPGLIASSSEGPMQIDPEHNASNSSTYQPTPQQPSQPQPNPSGIAIFTPSSVPSNTAHNAADFEPTVDHARAHQATLARQSVNKRLASDSELASQEAARKEQLQKIRSVVIRVRFPDQMIAELQLGQDDTVAGLYERVRGMLEQSSVGFELRAPGLKGGMESLSLEGEAGERRLIRDLGFSGRVLVTMVWAAEVSGEVRNAAVLKQELRGRAKELEAPKEVEVKEEKQEVRKVEGKPRKEGSKGDVEARMKRLLGLGKKK